MLATASLATGCVTPIALADGRAYVGLYLWKGSRPVEGVTRIDVRGMGLAVGPRYLAAGYQHLSSTCIQAGFEGVVTAPPGWVVYVGRSAEEACDSLLR